MLSVFFWEYLQNLPIFAGFVWGYTLWSQGRQELAVPFLVAGSLAGALLIALTESRKISGHREPASVVIANGAGMAVIMVGMVGYLSAHWSNWLTDLLIGVLAGVGLGALQSLAAREKISLRHCVALGSASPLALIAFRLLLRIGWPNWVNILGTALLATLIIGFLDYAPKSSELFRSA